MPIRVLVVDDHVSFRSLARRLLVDEGFEVIGEASDGRGAVQAAVDLRPDAVLLDVQLPDADGFGVAAALVEPAHPPQAVLVSKRCLAHYGQRVGRRGTPGFS